MLRRMISAGTAIIALGAMGASAHAGTINIDFANYANTFLSSADGVSFSLDSGYAVDGLGTTPYVNAFGNSDQIANSANYGAYPTSDTLTFSFSSAVGNVSLWMDNYGYSSSGRGDTFYQAFNAAGNLVSSGYVAASTYAGGHVNVAGYGITQLVLNNNTGDPTGQSSSWLFGVGSVHAVTGVDASNVPEPGTLALLGGCLAALGLVGFRRRKTSI